MPSQHLSVATRVALHIVRTYVYRGVASLDVSCAFARQAVEETEFKRIVQTRPPATSHKPSATAKETQMHWVRVRVRVCVCMCGVGGLPEEPLTGTHSTSMWMKLCSNRTPELVKFVPFF